MINIRFLMRVVIIMGVCAMSFEANAEGALQEPIESNSLTLSLTPPKLPSELLSNLRQIIDAGGLAQESVFREPSLKNLIGGDVFNWISNKPTLRMVNISHFPESFSIAARDERYSVYASFQKSNLQRQGQVIVLQIDPSLAVTQAMKLLGGEYAINRAHDGEGEHPTPLNRATSPDGNKVFSSISQRANAKTFVYITTDGDGTIAKISVTQQRGEL